MYLELDGQGARYAQLIRALKGAILDGRFAAGARLPASRSLARELDLSRNTVLAAYEQLQAEGFLLGRVGSGSFVANVGNAAPPKRAANALIAPLSAFARRALSNTDGRRIPGRQHLDLRYNLQYGLPLVNPLLASVWRREVSRAAEHAEFDYPDAQGLLVLREQVCDYLSRRRGVPASPEDVLIVSGTQQAFSLAARVLLEPGDTVVLEDPHYRGARQAFATHGAHARGCRVDADGLVPAALPASARLSVVTPSHQFPTGALLPLARRVELLDWAAAGSAWLIEDDYDSEFHYDGLPTACVQGLDRHGRTIYLGTFSKTLYPGLRMGYMALPDELVGAFSRARSIVDGHTPQVLQLTLARFMADGHYNAHVRAMRKLYAGRREAMLEAVGKHLAGVARALRPEGGLQVPCLLEPGWSEADTIRRAAQAGLVLPGLARLYADTPALQGWLLGYASLSAHEIDLAMRRLAVAIRKKG